MIAFSKIDEASFSESIEEARFLKSWAAQRPRGPISEIEEAPTFLALSAPVTRTLSFAEIMGILSKTSGEVEST
ncbi:hypothetical protein TB1_021833 [Malus domestica]